MPHSDGTDTTLRCRRSLKDLLAGFKTEAGLAVHWVWVGPSGRAARPAAGGVLPHYDQCAAVPSAAIKTFANTYWLQGLATHPHNFV